jgi:hypothetical protein
VKVRVRNSSIFEIRGNSDGSVSKKGRVIRDLKKMKIVALDTATLGKANLAPLSNTTHHLINKDTIALMKKGAFLIRACHQLKEAFYGKIWDENWNFYVISTATRSRATSRTLIT